ncbi:MAG: hypothetical protein KAS30_00220 [Candidatus Diapherotrites archaeon]|nr:hypothetical protein [Candidatus Diapherotrites archaeon]
MSEELINLTGKHLTIPDKNGDVISIPCEKGVIPRIITAPTEETFVLMRGSGHKAMVPILEQKVTLPPDSPGVFYIVPEEIGKLFPERSDFFVPINKTEEDGQIIADGIGIAKIHVDDN